MPVRSAAPRLCCPTVRRGDLQRRARRPSPRRGAARGRAGRLGYAADRAPISSDFAVAAGALARVLRGAADAGCAVPRSRTAAGRSCMLTSSPNSRTWRRRSSGATWSRSTPSRRDGAVRRELGAARGRQPVLRGQERAQVFEAALAGTAVASPTGPFRRVIRDGENGLLAASEAEWEAAMTLALIDDAGRARGSRMRRCTTRCGLRPPARREQMASLLRSYRGRTQRRAGLRVGCLRARAEGPRPIRLARARGRVRRRSARHSDVTVIVPLHNYARYVEEALEFGRGADAGRLDLVVVDDGSTDDSLAVARRGRRRTRAVQPALVLHHPRNAGLGPARNTGFDAAETPFVLPLDADNRLLPAAPPPASNPPCERCRGRLSGAAPFGAGGRCWTQCRSTRCGWSADRSWMRWRWWTNPPGRRWAATTRCASAGRTTISGAASPSTGCGGEHVREVLAEYRVTSPRCWPARPTSTATSAS